MADSSGLHMYGSIHLDEQLRNFSFESDFLVCRFSDSAILGMQFLSRHYCLMACDKELHIMTGKAFQCKYMMGWLLASKV